MNRCALVVLVSSLVSSLGAQKPKAPVRLTPGSGDLTRRHSSGPAAANALSRNRL